MNGIDATIPQAVGSRAMLIGEGFEEVLCFTALLKHLGITGVQVEQYNGKDKLRLYLRTLKARPGFASLEVLGVTRDADLDPGGAEASVQDLIQQAQFPSSLRVCWLILPTTGEPGALEDLCLATLVGSPLERCMDEFFACARGVSSRAFETGAVRGKARVHAWLALQDPPDLRLGHAAEKGLIDWSHPAFEHTKQFLQELFG